MRRALEGVAGVGQIDIQAGDADFTVHFDSKQIQPAAIVEALHKGGEKDAKVKA